MEVSVSDIPVIVFTGGPCAGKTTILSILQQKLTDIGFDVITVPEAATEFILSGLRPDVLGPFNFQKQLLEYILERENRWLKAAHLMPGTKKVVLCDRGTADASAYTSAHQYDLILGELGYTVSMIRDRRYHAVVFLRSTAVDAPEVYTCANNAARKESVEEARALDERTLAAWTGHERVKIVGNSTDLDGKVDRVFKIVCGLLGIPVPLEIERKYSISVCDLSLMPRPRQEIRITQYYLKSDNPEEEERIRIRENNGGQVYYHTVKKRVRSGVRTELEKQITAAQYFELLHRADPDFERIVKNRYCFVWKNQYFELDQFLDLSGTFLLEVELTEENDVVELPDFLKLYATDVTDDPSYSNREIARKVVGVV